MFEGADKAVVVQGGGRAWRGMRQKGSPSQLPLLCEQSTVMPLDKRKSTDDLNLIGPFEVI